MALKILLVEDTFALGKQVRDLLQAAEFDVTWVRTGDEALKQNPSNYALVVLDLMLPGAHGLEVLKAFRERSDTPVLILSARSDTRDVVRGLKLGADDYVTKPFWPEELLARVQTRLRRPVLQRGEVTVFGPLELELAARTVSVAGAVIDLTAAEFAVLATLAKRVGSAVTRRALAAASMDPEKDGSERTLDNHVSRLRQKLGEAGTMIKTVWGIGYRLEVEDDA